MFAFLYSSLFSSYVYADEPAVSTTIDTGMASISRANLDAFSGIQYASATLPLISRYQAQLGGNVLVDNGLQGNISGAVMDSSTGPIALGAVAKYATGQAALEGSALPGWRLPDEDLIRDYADVVVGLGTAVSFANRRYAWGFSGGYYGRTYVMSSEEGNIFTAWKNRKDEERIHQFNVGTSVAAKIGDIAVITTGVNDLMQNSNYTKPFVAMRLASVAQTNSIYENYGGVELDVEMKANSDEFALGYVGIAGDVRISQVFVRTGYRYDLGQQQHIPAFGFGLDDGRISLDYGVQLQITESIVQQHSVGLRFRL